MALGPMEHIDTSIGTILKDSSNTTSAYGTGAWVNVAGVTLSKGSWVICGRMELSASENGKTITANIATASGATVAPSIRFFGDGGGGAYMVAPFEITEDNTTVYVRGYRSTVVSQSTKFAGYIYAIKIT